MSYPEIAKRIAKTEAGVVESTMMKTPCLRYHGDFMAMLSEKAKGLIVKVAPERVDEIIASGKGREFNFTKKKFKEWVVVPPEHEKDFEGFIREALAYAREKRKL